MHILKQNYIVTKQWIERKGYIYLSIQCMLAEV